mgnify:CR=1 FL=1
MEVLDPLTYLAASQAGAEGARGPRTVTAYMPGRVVTLLVAEGAEVEVGQGVLVLEAMKMENILRAEKKGVVSKINAGAGDSLAVDDVIMEFE